MAELTDMVRGTPGTGAAETPSTSHYPAGLSVHLDHESLARLGHEDGEELPKAGHHFELHAIGHVAHSMSSADEEGKARHSVSLQITHMGLEHEEEEPEPRDHARRMYGPKEG